jgi:hypothetical protein
MACWRRLVEHRVARLADRIFLTRDPYRLEDPDAQQYDRTDGDPLPGNMEEVGGID